MLEYEGNSTQSVNIPPGLIRAVERDLGRNLAGKEEFEGCSLRELATQQAQQIVRGLIGANNARCLELASKLNLRVGHYTPDSVALGKLHPILGPSKNAWDTKEREAAASDPMYEELLIRVEEYFDHQERKSIAAAVRNAHRCRYDTVGQIRRLSLSELLSLNGVGIGKAVLLVSGFGKPFDFFDSFRKAFNAYQGK